jgi:hypothetical protein
MTEKDIQLLATTLAKSNKRLLSDIRVIIREELEYALKNMKSNTDFSDESIIQYDDEPIMESKKPDISDIRRKVREGKYGGIPLVSQSDSKVINELYNPMVEDENGKVSSTRVDAEAVSKVFKDYSSMI